MNARVLRNSYYSRKASEVIAEAAGSAYLTLLDAVTGFNQVDKIYAPGRDRKLRLMKQWLPYADDLTIRTGRVLDGVVYGDEEMTARVRAAVELSNVQEQQIGEALEACGFATKGLSTETGWSQAVGAPAPAPATSRPKKGVTQRGSPGKIGGATQGVEGVAGVEAEEEFALGNQRLLEGSCWPAGGSKGLVTHSQPFPAARSSLGRQQRLPGAITRFVFGRRDR